ncbi:MAG TPA: GT4 family glycosyltransferase PelF [Acidimicrobiales bacterium]|nr:GT4 family glycosyltransferase PelF [Acidimicrobiales bacterium]
MDVTLITEGTFPHHLGGVSVWCDQLIREMPDHDFRVLAVSGTGTERDMWVLPANVTGVEIVPLWAPSPGQRAPKKLRRRFGPVQERFLRSLAIDSQGDQFATSLRELAEFARAGELTPSMSSLEAVDLLMSLAPVCTDRPGQDGHGSISVADAVDVLILLEHFLRPLAVPPPRADVCHSTANGLGALPALAAKWAFETPFLLTEHGVYLRELYLSHKPGTLSQPARAIVLRFFKLLIEMAYKEADIVSPVCRYNRLWEVANGTSPARIRPIHNGVDPVAFPFVTDEPEVPTLVWVGRIDPLKDVETLLRAFAEVRAAIPDCRLRLFGPTPQGGEYYLDRCVKLMTELALDNGSVTFEGRVNPPLEAYRAGHLVLLTSISEGLPYVVLEAMASGRPVVATDVGGVAEAVGDAGILVPPRDPSAVAAACIGLLQNGTERRAMAEAARHRVLQMFTTERCFRMYRALYEELAGTNNEIIQLTEPDEVIQLPTMAPGTDMPGERLAEPGVLA